MKQLFITLLILLFSCSSKRKTPLEKGSLFVKKQLTKEYIQNETIFLSLEGDHTIKEWYDFFFSPLNTRDWITKTNELGIKPTALFIPDSVQIISLNKRPNISQKYQIIISIDTLINHVIIEGKETPKKEKIFVERVVFPKFP